MSTLTNDAVVAGRATRASADAWLIGVGVGSLAAVAAALVTQHGFGMEPCPWCVLQRLIFVAIAIACAIGLVWRRREGRMVAALLVGALGLSGIAAALWQHFVAAASSSCNLTFADRVVGAFHADSLLPDVFSARASCADAAVRLFGVPYEFWSLALFVAALIGAWQIAIRSKPQTSTRL